MLKKAEKHELEEYMDFACGLALDRTRSGYPTYTDGIKTREDFASRAMRGFEDENEEILLFRQDGEVRGWIHYFYIPEDKYLQTVAFSVSEGTREALAEFLDYMRSRFSGCELYLGFPAENTEATAALSEAGLECISDNMHCDAALAEYEPREESSDIVPVTRENFPLFAELHSQYEGDMYWSAARLREALDEWRIFMLMRGGRAAGAVYCTDFAGGIPCAEIFGIDIREGGSPVRRALLTAALNCEKRRGMRHLLYFAEKAELADVLACGFRSVGGYVCFKEML